MENVNIDWYFVSRHNIKHIVTSFDKIENFLIDMEMTTAAAKGYPGTYYANISKYNPCFALSKPTQMPLAGYLGRKLLSKGKSWE